MSKHKPKAFSSSNTPHFLHPPLCSHIILFHSIMCLYHVSLGSASPMSSLEGIGKFKAWEEIQKANIGRRDSISEISICFLVSESYKCPQSYSYFCVGHPYKFTSQADWYIPVIVLLLTWKHICFLYTRQCPFSHFRSHFLF